MNLVELINKLRQDGDRVTSWYEIETNVESVSDLEKTEEGFFLNFKLKDKHIDEEELDSLARDYSYKEYGNTGTGHFVGINDFKAGYRKAKEEQQ